MTDHPTLFNGPMILAIMTCSQCGTVTLEIECPECGSKERCKTQTRRVLDLDMTVLPNSEVRISSEGILQFRCPPENNIWRDIFWGNNRGPKRRHCKPIKSPLGVPGDLLWVKEPFRIESATRLSQVVHGVYTRDGSDFHCRLTNSEWAKFKKWTKPCSGKSSLFMFKSLCRLWLKVKSVRVERVQEISGVDILAEGINPPIPPNVDPPAKLPDGFEGWSKSRKDEYFEGVARTMVFCQCADVDNCFKAFRELWDSINAKPRPRYTKKIITHYESYPWEDIRETREYRGKPWHVIGNPFVFATEFERTEQ